MSQRQNDQIGQSHALIQLYIYHKFALHLYLCLYICSDCARCPIPMHSEGCRFQMAMLTSQFSAQRVGGAYLVITETNHNDKKRYPKLSLPREGSIYVLRHTW